MKSVEAFLDFAKESNVFNLSNVKIDRWGCAKAIEYGQHCTISLLNDSESKLAIGNIEVAMQHRSLGIGSKAMKALLSYADDNKVTLTLYPRSHSQSPIDTKRLTSWYESMGFIQTPRGHERKPNYKPA